MARRIARIAVWVVGSIGALCITAIGYAYWQLREIKRETQKYDLTGSLTNEQTINLNERLRSKDVCIVPSEVMPQYFAARERPGYKISNSIQPEDPLFFLDSSSYWSVLVFDDENKTYTSLHVRNKIVALEDDKRSYCSDSVSLRIRRGDHDWIATVLR